MMSMMDVCYFGFLNEIKLFSWVWSKFLKLVNNKGFVKNWVLKYVISGMLG